MCIPGPHFRLLCRTSLLFGDEDGPGSQVQADIRTISNAAALYEIDHGVFPASIDDLVTKDSDGKQYLQFKPLTPDKGEYQIADGVVSADYNNKHFSSDAASAQEGKG